MAQAVLEEVLAEAADAEALAEDICGGPEILVVAEHPGVLPEPKVKRPRHRRPNETCPGRDGTPCIFSLQARTLGQAARCRHGEAACTWCSPASLTAQLENPYNRRHVTRALRIWSEADESGVLAAAWQRVPESYHATLTAALARPSRAKAAVAARRAAADAAQSWHTLLAHRVNPGLPVSADADAVYRAKKADDERRLRAKFGPWMAARADGDESWRPELATRFEAWCRETSWAMCQQCHRLEPRPVWERDITSAGTNRSSRHTIARCQHCRAGTGYPTVSPDFIPPQLRNLSLNVLWALRPLSPDVGLPVFARHGYRVHTDMIRFWWRPRSIGMLSDVERTAATTAYDYLMGADDSSYSRFVYMHNQFLRRYRSDLSGEERDGRLRLPRRALEEVGLECAVWPHLYPRTTMCETHIRKADVRRRGRPVEPGSSMLDSLVDAEDAVSADEGMQDLHDEQEEDCSEADEAEAAAPLDFARSGRNSAKSAYLAKVLGSTLQRFPVPVPWESELPERVQQYLSSPWRAADMPGTAEPLESLEVWSNNAPLCGDVAVAAIYLSRYSDRYYGQWVLMNVPFRSLEELYRPELDLVPSHLYYQTLAFLLRPQHWTSEEAIRAELELEAFREHHVRNIVAMLFANQGLIRRYLSGELDKNEDVPSPEAAAQSFGGGARVRLSVQQRRIADELVDSAQEGMRRRQQREDAWRGEGWDSPDPADAAAANPAWAADPSPFAGVVDARTPFAVLGPAGSGKTTAVHDAIQRVSAAGGRILLTAPTGRLAAALRERFPDLEVDTVHGAFLVHKPAQEALEVLWPYDLIVVEEVGQLSRTIFERILEQWQATDQIPTLVFVGDFYQLPGVDPTSALDSPHWHSVLIKKRQLQTMQRCKCPKLRKALELLRIGKPSVEQLRQIKAGHKAPSLRRAGYVMNAEPSMEDVAHILEETPNTLFLTISRRACAQLNDAAVAALFRE
ncbi:pif1, partial [Symbiodinium sp. CCMP2592]